MSIRRFASNVWHLYYDGFREMTTGRQLWLLIAIKVVLIFVIMKLLFFPNLLKSDYDNDIDRAKAVRSSLLDSRR